MTDLLAAAERRKNGYPTTFFGGVEITPQRQLYRDTEALADAMASLLTNPEAKAAIEAMKHLPPGPWQYMPMELDQWGKVRDPENFIVADTCAGMEGCEFYKQVCDEFGFGSPEWKAGPAKARAVAMLLIWAQKAVSVLADPPNPPRC